jgi:hypothetical protein
MPVAAKIDFSLQVRELLTTYGRGAGPMKNLLGRNRGIKQLWSDGVGNKQIDRLYFRENPVAIAASGNQDFDLAGSLADSFGTTITMAEIVGVVVLNFNTAGTLTVRAAAVNGLASWFVALGDGHVVGKAVDGDTPGIYFGWSPVGVTVTAGTGDLLNLLNNDASNAADYAIGLFGRSA